MNKKLRNTLIILGSLFIVVAMGLWIGIPLFSHMFYYPAAPRVDKNKKHIACIGDSITFGAGVMYTHDKESYPAYLQKLVPEEYQVLNYGLNGRTLMSSGNKPYVNEYFYGITHDIKADIYIIMLGTNDSKAYNWDKAGIDGINYKNDLINFVNSYKNLDNSPEIYLMQPPKAFSNIYDIDNNIISTKIYAYVQEVSEELNTHLIDLYSFTKDHEDWYFDGVHPNKIGNEGIANYIYTNLMI